jgi:hypothetical protein
VAPHREKDAMAAKEDECGAVLRDSLLSARTAAARLHGQAAEITTALLLQVSSFCVHPKCSHHDASLACSRPVCRSRAAWY